MKNNLKILFLLMFIFSIYACKEKSNINLPDTPTLNATIPTTTDSSYCMDSVVYVALALLNDTTNPIVGIISNIIYYDSTSGSRYYFLRLDRSSGSPITAICDYWDESNNSYLRSAEGEGKTMICTCINKDGCSGCTIEYNQVTGEKYCTVNGNANDGAVCCELSCKESKLNNTNNRANGINIFNNLTAFSTLTMNPI